MEENKETNEQSQSKIERKFADSMKRLVAVVGGAEKIRIPTAIPGDAIAGVVKDLFKEETDELIKSVKDGLRGVLKQYAEMEKAFKAKQKELADLERQKKEEFIKAVDALFRKVQDVGQLESAYYEGLKTAISPTVDE